ncbi:hypothetical protein GGS21DRAFT_545655 [Xylaria nigripes]|nr:hypothetical protein GGS21DRAFT_545655 [Xylaria nigripes]
MPSANMSSVSMAPEPAAKNSRSSLAWSTNTIGTPNNPKTHVHKLARRCQRLFKISDETIGEIFTLAGDVLDSATIGKDWNKYLHSYNYWDSFQPLRGFEHERYCTIIGKAKLEEEEAFRSANDALNAIQESRRKNENPQADNYLERIFTKLDDYVKGGLRYNRTCMDCPRRHFKTNFGILNACSPLPTTDWYAGHNPGDPIARVKGKPATRSIDEEFFYVPELADEAAETCEVKFEGVVPFHPHELHERLATKVIPDFIRMMIAALGYDPNDEKRRAHLFFKVHLDVQDLWATEFRATGSHVEASFLRLLQRIWCVKYGNVTDKYPQFLRTQIANSISRFRELGWIIGQLEQDKGRLVQPIYLRRCKELLTQVTGRNAAELARDYCNITLAEQSEALLRKGTKDIFIYHDGKVNGKKFQLEDVYNRTGPVAYLTKDQVNNFCDVTLPIPANTAVAPYHQQGPLAAAPTDSIATTIAPPYPQQHVYIAAGFPTTAITTESAYPQTAPNFVETKHGDFSTPAV